MTEEKEKYIKSLIDSRKVSSFCELPEEIQHIIIKFIIDRNIQSPVYLCGSFASGKWCISEEDEMFNIRKELYNKTKLSDIDLYIPNYTINDMDDMLINDYEYKIHVLPVPLKNCVLITPIILKQAILKPSKTL